MNLAKTLAIRRKIDFLRHLVVHEFCRRTAFERSEGQKLHCLSGLATSRSNVLHRFTALARRPAIHEGVVNKTLPFRNRVVKASACVSSAGRTGSSRYFRGRNISRSAVKFNSLKWP
jgi:hypothetical protein